MSRFGDPDRLKCIGRVKLKDDVTGEYLRGDDGKIQTRPCKNDPISGAKVCRMHGGKAKQVAAKAAVVAEVAKWGLGDPTIDPGETLLRLVSQSAARADLYSRLLSEAYDAAERLRTAHEAQKVFETADDLDGEPAAAQVARDDLNRIFTTGGVAALVGNTYGDSKTGGIYATGEAIRGLAKLEAEERDRCASMAAKAVAAGLAERTVKLAERQGELIAQVLMAVFDDLDLSDGQREVAPNVIRRHLAALAS